MQPCDLHGFVDKIFRQKKNGVSLDFGGLTKRQFVILVVNYSVPSLLSSNKEWNVPEVISLLKQLFFLCKHCPTVIKSSQLCDPLGLDILIFLKIQYSNFTTTRDTNFNPGLIIVD